jgi:hypothetical protein
MNNNKHRIHLAALFVLLSLSSLTRTNGQILGFFPQAESIGVSGSCVPPSLVCELRTTATGIDTVIIRSPHDAMYIGPPVPGSPLINRCYFTVRNTGGGNRYNLIFDHQRSYYGDSVRIPFDSVFHVGPGSFTISLFVSNPPILTDSATARFHAAQTGLSVEELPTGTGHVFALYQNYPNPFNPTTRIEYDLRVTSHVSLKVVDLLGRHIATLVDGFQNAGRKSIEFDAAGYPSGIYLYRLQVGEFATTRKCLMIR